MVLNMKDLHFKRKVTLAHLKEDNILPLIATAKTISSATDQPDRAHTAPDHSFGQRHEGVTIRGPASSA